MVRARPERSPHNFAPSKAAPRFLAVPASMVLVVAGLTACGGGDDEMMEPPPPPPPPTTTLQYDVSDPCSTAVPQPNNLFIDSDGRTERDACPKPSDPVEAAVFTALLEEGSPLNTLVTLPVDGSLDSDSLTSTTTFTWTSTSSPGAVQEGLPPIVVLKQVGAASVAAGWETVEAAVTFSAGNIQIQPQGRLDEGTRYVVIATRGLRDLESPPSPLAQSPIVAAVSGTSPVVATGLEGVDDAGAARLERQRQALQPLVELISDVKVANPPIPRSEIVSIHAFDTQLGFDRINREVERYFDAIERRRYTFDVNLTEVILSSIFVGIPPTAYPDVGQFFRGVIKVPKFLDDRGRWRKDWPQVVETVDMHLTISVPSGVTGGPVVLHIPGHGRGSVDGRSLAQGMAQIPAAYVMTVDMRCHGFRSPEPGGACQENRTEEQISNLVDTAPNNNNRDIQGPDGIPDDSGIGFFPGDPVALRDSQMAAILELVHVLNSLLDPGSYQPDVNPNISRLHVVAQGYMAPLALIATALLPELRHDRMTVQLPSGGAGLAELILNSASDQRNKFLAEVPEGIDETNLGDLLDDLSVMFAPLDLANYGSVFEDLYSTGGSFRRILVPHGAVDEFITSTARTNLTDAIGLPNNRISEHRPGCDDFYLYSCQVGQDVILQQTAIEQLVRFVDSTGVTLVDPAR